MVVIAITTKNIHFKCFIPIKTSNLHKTVSVNVMTYLSISRVYKLIRTSLFFDRVKRTHVNKEIFYFEGIYRKPD